MLGMHCSSFRQSLVNLGQRWVRLVTRNVHLFDVKITLFMYKSCFFAPLSLLSGSMFRCFLRQRKPWFWTTLQWKATLFHVFKGPFSYLFSIHFWIIRVKKQRFLSPFWLPKWSKNDSKSDTKTNIAKRFFLKKESFS